MSLHDSISRDSASLDGLRKRAGVRCSSLDLATAVCEAYTSICDIPHEEMVHRFRSSGTADHLGRAIAAGGAVLARAERILLVGCGKGIAGRGSVMLRDLLDLKTRFSGRISFLDLNGEEFTNGLHRLTSRAPVNAIITHSFLHFLMDPGTFLTAASQTLAPGGFLLLAHEPNRRHFQDRSYSSSGPLANWLPEPVRMLKSTLLRQETPLDIRLNRQLRQQFGLKRNLKLEEILAIVDPYLPHNPRRHPLGAAGFDWKQLGAEFLPGFELVWVETYGPGNERPLMGRSFTALWKARVQ